MLRSNICPRCRGYVVLDRDRYGWFEQCLQCGYEHNLDNIVEAHQQLVEGESEVAWPS